MSTTTKIALPRNQGEVTVRVYTQATETRAIDLTVIEFTFEDGHGDRRSYVELSVDGRPDHLTGNRFTVVLDNHDTDDFQPRPEPEQIQIDPNLLNEVYTRLMAEKEQQS